MKWKLAAVVAVLATSMFSPQARAATAHVDAVDPEFVELFYDAAPGEQNDLEATGNGQVEGVRLVDTGAVITAGAGCSQVDAHEVFCSVAYDVWGRLWIELGDQNDAGTFSNLRDTIVSGGAGGDHLTEATQGVTQLSGDGGADVLQGSYVLTGGAGNDTLTATGDDVTLDGDAGDDTLIGGAGYDSFRPGPGDDTVDGGPPGGFGTDAVLFDLATGPVYVNLTKGEAAGEGHDTLVGIEDIFGGPFDNILIGNERANLIEAAFASNRVNVIIGKGGADRLYGGRGQDFVRGGGGADWLFGYEANDVLRGGRGPDELHGGLGRDVLRGARGDDRLFAHDGHRDFVRGGIGRDRARVDRRDVVSGVEKIFGL